MIRDYINEVCDLNRSLVTDGYREALSRLDGYADGDVETFDIPSGSSAWTWTVPQDWSVSEAYIEDGSERLIEYDHPLRVVTYSDPIDTTVSKSELLEHVHVDREIELNGETIPANPQSLPYIFDFYGDEWGFCLRHEERYRIEASPAERFRVRIDAEFQPGSLRVGQYEAPGRSEETVFLMAHLDHPAQANDGLSGVAVGANVIDRLRERDLRYTYKLFVVPETIGSLAFFSHHEETIPELTYGVYLEMLGNAGNHALQHSHQGDTRIDRISTTVLDAISDDYTTGPFREVIGNDEMVTNGPGMRVPTVSLSRWPYDEYHTSHDSPKILSESQLQSSADVVEQIAEVLEHDLTPVRQFKGPIFLSGYGLWQKWGGRGQIRQQFESMVMYLEGDHTVLDIAEKHGIPFWDVFEFTADLHREGLIEYEEDTTHLLRVGGDSRQSGDDE